MATERRRLEREEWHFGFPCAAGSEIDTYARSGTLSRDVRFRGVELPAASRFSRNVDHDFLAFTLAHPTRVHGIEVAGQSVVEFPPLFSPPIKILHWLWLWPWLWLDGLRRAARGYVTVVSATSLQLPIGKDQLEVEPGERFECDKFGVIGLRLSSPRWIGADRLESGWLRFDRVGRLSEALLYRPQELRGFPVEGSGLVGREVRFFPSGQLRRFVLREYAVVDSKLYRAQTQIVLDERGRVVRAKPVR